MLSRTAFTIIALLGVALVMSSCGKLNQEEFEMWKNEHVSKMEQTNSDMSNKMTMLEGKVDQHSKDSAEAISRAKDEAIAVSQQGDADTMAAAEQKAKEQDAQLRADLTKAIDMQGQKSMDFAKSEGAKIQKQLMAVEDTDKAQNEAINQLASKVMAIEEGLAMVTEEVSSMPTLLATVTFASGRTSLDSDAKQMLDGIV